MNIKRLLFWILILIIFSETLYSMQDSAASGKPHLYPLPKFSWNPEIHFAAGAELLYILGRSSANKINTLAGECVFSQLNHVMSSLTLERYLKKNYYVVSLTYTDFPKLFYGIGSHTLKTQRESFTPQSISFSVNLNRYLNSNWFIGYTYRFNHTKLLKTELGGILDSKDIIGKTPEYLSGVGMNIGYDSRSDLLYPTSGTYFYFSILPYQKMFGGSLNFIKTSFDMRHYLKLHNRIIFANQLYFQTSSGTVPFYAMSIGGGNYILRGYNPGRYRDNNLFMLQTEIRNRLFWRIGMAVFAGIGDVFREVKSLSMSYLKYSYGCGLRINVAKKEVTHIRIDFAFGRQSFYPVITLREAF